MLVLLLLLLLVRGDDWVPCRADTYERREDAQAAAMDAEGRTQQKHKQQQKCGGAAVCLDFFRTCSCPRSTRRRAAEVDA